MTIGTDKGFANARGKEIEEFIYRLKYRVKNFEKIIKIMKAIRVNELGGADKLTLEEIEKPMPKADEVLMKVAAAGINYADTMMRSGNYLTKPDLPFTLGYEAAGTIEELGEEVSNLKIGQRVLATVSSGGYAEYATAKAEFDDADSRRTRFWRINRASCARFDCARTFE